MPNTPFIHSKFLNTWNETKELYDTYDFIHMNTEDNDYVNSGLLMKHHWKGFKQTNNINRKAEL